MRCGARERDGARLLSCACALLLCCVALTAAAAERESQLAPAPFILGSRFGRSPPRLLMPRNDKFFFSSRYGKRAPLPPLDPPPPPLAPPSPPSLLCAYTGVRALYRCRPATVDTTTAHDNRIMDAPSPEED